MFALLDTLIFLFYAYNVVLTKSTSSDRIHWVLMHYHKTGHDLCEYFGDKVFKTIIPRNVRLAEAPSFGKTILEHDKWSKGARAYKQLTKEVDKRVSTK